MKSFVLAVALLLAPATFAQLEGTARLPVDPTRNLQAMQLVPVCPPGTPVAVSGTRFVCGRSVADYQIGTVDAWRDRPWENGTLELNVPFPYPFSTAPRVFLFINLQEAGGPCRGYNNNHNTPEVRNVTTTGFSISVPSYRGGCGWERINELTWFATSNASAFSVQNDLASGAHSSQECRALGGAITFDGRDKFCRIQGSVCPTGWSRFREWSSNDAENYMPCNGMAGLNGQLCRINSKAWSNATPRFGRNGDRVQCTQDSAPINCEVRRITEVGCV